MRKPIKFYVHEENPIICLVQTINLYLDKQNNNVGHDNQCSSLQTENHLGQLMKTQYLVGLGN